MFNFLKAFTNRFKNSKEFVESQELPTVIHLNENKEVTKFSKEQLDEFFKVIDFDKVIQNNLVKVDFDNNRIVDFTGEVVNANASLVIQTGVSKNESVRKLQGQASKNWKKNQDAVERTKLKKLEIYFDEKSKKDAKEILTNQNNITLQNKILEAFKEDIINHFKEKLRR